MSSLTREQRLSYIENIRCDMEGCVLTAGNAPERTAADAIELLCTAAGSASVVARCIEAFLADVTPQMKQDVQDSTLLAQLAANYFVGGGPEKDVTKWYGKFSDVLMTLGWLLGDFNQHDVPDADQYEDASALILKLAAGYLPTNKLALLKVAIDALARPANDKALEIFERCSRAATGAAFQLGVVSFSDGDPSLDIIPVNYSIGLKDANPLLFKWRKPYISFQTGHQTMRLSTEIYDLVRQKVREKIKNEISASMAAIKIR